MAQPVKRNSAAGRCRDNDNVTCSEPLCDPCGWNPHNGVRERRIRAAIQDRDAELRRKKARVLL